MADAPEPDAEGAREGPVDLETIRRLLDLMSEHGLAELEIEREDMAVRLRKAGAEPPALVAALPAAGTPQAAAAAQPPPPGEAEPAGEDLPTITSPMVGTFYEASSPDADPFVQVGDHVTEDTVVCIIEAMKVFNEIRAETSGTIEKVLVANAEAVEFGQPLFVVRPD
ncbi:MAG: acetyl-CoA carboxylase biotin carboxyl carrier protein [Phycisphaerae bacterium]